MKTCTISTTGMSGRWTISLGAMLTVVLVTFAAIAAGPAPVSLGTSADFAIIAKTGISVTGVTAITGDVGISPAAATYITGCGLIMDASGAFSTSALVVGNTYAADYTDPTPATLTTAVGDMETAYTNAAGRTSPDYTELYAGDLTGKTLTPGLYKWGTGVLVSAAGVTVAGDASDVWIFQIAQNLELANGAMVTLSGGARASNIFWQVAGQVTLGTTAVMKGIILCQTAIVMSTGATLDGRALAQTAVTLDANTVTAPDIASVVINSLRPQNSAFNQDNHNQTILFAVPSDGRVTLRLLNIRGQEVATVFNGEVTAGMRNHVSYSRSGLAKGLYFSKLEFKGKIKMMKMLLAR
jgi:hypothetical protein